jgi:hypothetical protein
MREQRAGELEPARRGDRGVWRTDDGTDRRCVVEHDGAGSGNPNTKPGGRSAAERISAARNQLSSNQEVELRIRIEHHHQPAAHDHVAGHGHKNPAVQGEDQRPWGVDGGQDEGAARGSRVQRTQLVHGHASDSTVIVRDCRGDGGRQIDERRAAVAGRGDRNRLPADGRFGDQGRVHARILWLMNDPINGQGAGDVPVHVGVPATCPVTLPSAIPAPTRSEAAVSMRATETMSEDT